MHFDLVTHGVQNGRQRADRAERAVQLATAVVRHDDGIRPGIHSGDGVFGLHDAFHNHRAVPHLLELFDAIPVQ